LVVGFGLELDIRVLIVSMGALEKGPIAPDIRPIIMCWYEGKSARSGWNLCASFFISWYAVKLAPARYHVVGTCDKFGHETKLAYLGW
jgi:hypothetical protein